MSRMQLHRHVSSLDSIDPFPVYGKVTNVTGLIIEGFLPKACIGSVAEVIGEDGQSQCLVEVVGLKNEKVQMMPLGDIVGLSMSSTIVLREKSASLKISDELLGRVIDARGNPIDGGEPFEDGERFSIYSAPINPLRRARIEEPLDLGVRAINGLLTVGKGQRIGIISGSGVGKSMLLGMMARHTKADVNVIGLIGERGREVREFIEKDLGEEGMARSIVVVAPSDASPVIRMRAAYTASTIAEYFRKAGKDVLLMMDSVTRFAMARREIGLSIGEPPTTKGYPPSVFTLLPKLFERAGNTSSGGSITGIYTVLVEADDINDPIGDAVRSIVDGHILLSRKLVARNQFPAIDIPYSASRTMGDITTDQHRQMASKIKNIISTYAEAEDLINIGAYVTGANAEVDEAVRLIQPVRNFLKQDFKEPVSFEQTLQAMQTLLQPTPGPRAGGIKR